MKPIVLKDAGDKVKGQTHLRIHLLKTMKDRPVHSVQIFGDPDAITLLHDKFFDVINGRYQPNFIGKKLGAQISSSSYTIDFNTTDLKSICTYGNIAFVNIIRYTTF